MALRSLFRLNVPSSVPITPNNIDAYFSIDGTATVLRRNDNTVRHFGVPKRERARERQNRSAIDDRWNFSKGLFPSREHHRFSTNNQFSWNSISSSKFHSRANDLSCDRYSREKLRNARDYSSCEDKTSKPNGLLDKTSAGDKKEISTEECREEIVEKDEEGATRPSVAVEEIQQQPVCKQISCSDIRDYCSPEAVPRRDTFWKVLSILCVPVIVILSGFVYKRVEEKGKEPRPEFLDVSYMRRIVKPFPWGDGKRTLFHNPERNPISPHGYEVEDPNASHTGKSANDSKNPR